MKKVFFLLAVAAMFSFTACNNNAEAPVEDTTLAAEEIVEAPVADTTAVDSAAVETVATEEVAQ